MVRILCFDSLFTIDYLPTKITRFWFYVPLFRSTLIKTECFISFPKYFPLILILLTIKVLEKMSLINLYF